MLSDGQSFPLDENPHFPERYGIEGAIDFAQKEGDDTVLLEKIEKEVYSITREGAVERVVIEIDKDGLQTMTLYRIRLTATGDEVVVHSFTFEEFVDNGEIYTKIIRDDGYYFIVIQPKDPKITESYDPDGILLTRTTEFLDRETGELSIEKEFFDREGNLIETRNCTMRFILLGDEIIITKTFDNGDEVTLRIREEENGYTVNRNGLVYSVRFIANGVEIYDENMDLIATVTFNEDGTWTVIYPDGSEETVNI